MSEVEDIRYGPLEDESLTGGRLAAGGRWGATARGAARQANPDDLPVQRPPQGPRGPLPGPSYLGSPGRIAIVQGQVFIVAVILIAQLWLITSALYEWLSGRPQDLGWLTLASGLGFLIALIVWYWPRRRIKGP